MDWRASVERIADDLESVARSMDKTNPVDQGIATELYGKAWDLKQYARAGSPSEGI